MTREEAVTELKLFKESAIPWDVPILLAAIDMAIEALQTPPISQRSMYQAGYRQAQEDRPRGEWIEHDGTWLCSYCGEEDAYAFGKNKKQYDYFCPNCGSDMRGGND